ncbi:hypothetical protein I305_06790 [Cryptococcus gattii E566]|uniref:Copper transport protein n=1 Tax=Cryptococcus gattii EJB2 TaxID=1296103 RepID=A0ABR5C3B7_9TREE|nr:hypothetical protein I306_00473 [Cryptococcus gattii EJB2]KIY30794.1 hypothetical protein I305_06790 [Cryptococcus gattii E566]KJE00877.1 hypothetical protein I311_05507 [Cryptococcus gattii NT-10]
MSMSMKMYFHGTIGGDMLWFASWMPSSAGATVGVCIGLFILAIFERYLIAFRRACDAAWRKGQVGYVRPCSNGPLTSSSAKSTSLQPPVLLNRRSSNKKEDVLFTPSAYAFESNHDGAVEPVAPYSPSVLAVRDCQEGNSAPSYTHSQQGQTQAQGQSELGMACNPFAEERVAEIERYKEKAVEAGVVAWGKCSLDDLGQVMWDIKGDERVCIYVCIFVYCGYRALSFRVVIVTVC